MHVHADPNTNHINASRLTWCGNNIQTCCKLAFNFSGKITQIGPLDRQKEHDMCVYSGGKYLWITPTSTFVKHSHKPILWIWNKLVWAITMVFWEALEQKRQKQNKTNKNIFRVRHIPCFAISAHLFMEHKHAMFIFGIFVYGTQTGHAHFWQIESDKSMAWFCDSEASPKQTVLDLTIVWTAI